LGILEIDMFTKDVDDPFHPKAEQFRLILEQVADDYECNLLTFEVSKGTVSFSFDNDKLTAEVLKLL
jgi:hypothetical protein